MRKLCNHLLLSAAFLCCTLIAGAQVKKGVTGDDNTSPGATGKTRALVVGVSRYQYVPSLQYADKDATAFSHFLSASTFWNIQPDDVVLLTNEQARCGDIITELSRLIQVSKPGDRVLFYFSGHGDIETITQFNNGFLLAYDTYKNNYITGAVPVNFLKEVFLTMLNKDVRVFMFTDACRSGNLAGGLKGTEYAAEAISSVWKNEIKILSSQPGQLSYEDKKWGNGRGVFSYYLTQGMAGAADENKDSVITLAELENYVGRNVSEATGNKQQPIFEGPNKYTTVVSGTINTTSPGKPGGKQFLPGTKPLILFADSCTTYYRLLNEAIQNKRLLGGPSAASSYYRKLKSCSKDMDLVLKANRKLLAALINESQPIVNSSLEAEHGAAGYELEHGVELMDAVLQNNDLNIPTRHYLNIRRYLQASSRVNNPNPDQETLNYYNKVIDSAIVDEPDAAYLLNTQGIIRLKSNDVSGAINSFSAAIKLSPTWLLPQQLLRSSITAAPKKAGKPSVEKAIQIGFKGGLNYAGIKDTGSVAFDHKVDFHAGFLVRIKVGSTMTVQGEVLYSGQGAQRSIQGTAEKQVLTYNYINIPLLVQYLPIPKLALEFGPQAGILITAKQKASGRTTDIKDSYHSTDISAVAGLAYSFTTRIGLDLRYTIGLKNIAKSSTNISVKNDVGQAGIFILL